jgi:serine/threonine protein kinase
MADLIYCNNCGGANPPGRHFCFSCGKPLTTSAQAGTTPFSTGLTPPKTLLKQRYRILRTVGKGGMGAVYEAEDIDLGDRLVAVKEMSQHSLKTPQELAAAADNFKREAHLLAKLNNPHLPSIHDYFTENGRWYLVMSFIPGETLLQYLHAKGERLPVEETLHIGVELCEVLGYLHSQQPPIIFRDLKPSNIMRTPDGQIYLIDFGIARHFKPGQTRDTAIFGSLGYAAPEQYGSSQTTPRSDIYSLGVILYQMLTGLRPSIAPFTLSTLTSLDIIIPPALTTLIMSMLAVEEDQRPQSMQEVLQELEQIEHAAAYAPTIVGARIPVGAAAPSAPAQKQASQIQATAFPTAQATPQPAPARPQQPASPQRQQQLQQQFQKARLNVSLVLAAIIARLFDRQQWEHIYLKAVSWMVDVRGLVNRAPTSGSAPASGNPPANRASTIPAPGIAPAQQPTPIMARLPLRQMWQKLHMDRSQIQMTIVGIIGCALLVVWLDRGHFPTWFTFTVGQVAFRVSLFLVVDVLTLTVAIVCGMRSGPLVGLLTGGVGTLLGDVIGMAGGRFGWNWDVRVALVGLIAGLLLMWARQKQQPFSRRLINGISALAILIGTAFASYSDLWLRHEPTANASSIFIVYSIISMIICWLVMTPLFRFVR